MKSFIFLFCFQIGGFSFAQKVIACSIIYSTDGINCVAGGNEDWSDINSMIKLRPSQTEKYGYLSIGYKDEDWNVDFLEQIGINDQGLFYDWASTGKVDKEFHAKGTQSYRGSLPNRLMEECATVEEAILLFKEYNCPGFGGAHILIGDKFGNSVIIEKTADGSLLFIKNSGSYQIATNFLTQYLIDPEVYRWIQCPRYEYIDEILYNTDTVSVDLFRDILQHVGSNQNIAPTIHTHIYDFKSDKLYIYNYYNYEEVLVIDLKTELIKGYQFYKLPELFSNIKSLQPLDNEILKSESNVFKWLGEANNYELWISKDADFINPQIHTYSAGVKNVTKARFTPIYLIIAFMILGIYKQKRIVVFAFLLFIILGCEDYFTDLPSTISNKEHLLVVEDLQPNTRYFWKVATTNQHGLKTESKTKSFLTQ